MTGIWYPSQHQNGFYTFFHHTLVPDTVEIKSEEANNKGDADKFKNWFCTLTVISFSDSNFVSIWYFEWKLYVRFLDRSHGNRWFKNNRIFIELKHVNNMTTITRKSFDLHNSFTILVARLVTCKRIQLHRRPRFPIRTKDMRQLIGGLEAYDEAHKRTTSVLTITAVSSDDAGAYQCEADFEGTSIKSNIATVDVYGNKNFISMEFKSLFSWQGCFFVEQYYNWYEGKVAILTWINHIN